MQIPDYNITKGTEWGEIRNEVFCKYGQEAYSTFMHGWTTTHDSFTKHKTYNLVNSNEGVKFLIALVETEEWDSTGKIPEIIKIEFLWRDANIPFLTQQELHEQNIPYTL